MKLESDVTCADDYLQRHSFSTFLLVFLDTFYLSSKKKIGFTFKKIIKQNNFNFPKEYFLNITFLSLELIPFPSLDADFPSFKKLV